MKNWKKPYKAAESSRKMIEEHVEEIASLRIEDTQKQYMK